MAIVLDCSLALAGGLGHPAWPATDLFLRKALGNPHRRQMPCLDLLPSRDPLQPAESGLVKSNREDFRQWTTHTHTEWPARLEEAREVFVAKPVPCRSLFVEDAAVRGCQSLRHCWYLRLVRAPMSRAVTARHTPRWG